MTATFATNGDAPAPHGTLLLQYLIQTRQLTADDAERTQQLARERSQSVGMLLTRTGLVADRDVAAAYARIFDRPLLGEQEIDAVTLPGYPYKETFLREARIVPLSADADNLMVATADPENIFALDALVMATGKSVSFSIATVSQIERALDCLFAVEKDDVDEAFAQALEADSEDSADAVDRLRDLASEAPVVRFVNAAIQKAVEARASDIHIEPCNGRLRVRYRIDGVLQELGSPPPHSSAAVISRIKLMSKMNIAERRLPQDGRVHVRVQGAVIDLRVSTVPTVEGESVVLRILDQDHVPLDMSVLGFDPEAAGLIQRAIEQPHGITLVTGPTGSGKTTTLYTVLQRLNTPERKILTIEDPVEYQLEGINQIQVKPRIGLDFAGALRSIVRQDPDIIMVGEMRDVETARIAVQSALTGHLVFSTLHTNDSASAITRMVDMGIEDYLVTSAVNAIVAQRLVRRLCTACRKPFEPLPEVITRLGLDELCRGPITLYTRTGCEHCGHTGYRGRIVIAEVLVLSDALRQAILERADTGAIQKLAVEKGMQLMRIDGLRKAIAGTTTIEEVDRVTYG